MKERELKEKLELYAQNYFQPPEESELLGIIPEMLNHIGALESYLRDDLIYTTFATWILKYKAIRQSQLRELVHTIISSQHLFYHIGEKDTDSVFHRSFSMLLLPLLLTAHRSDPYLTHDEIFQIKNKLIVYLKNEKDLRGYVKDKGWAHSVAHASDTLDDLAQCAELAKTELIELLELIHAVVCVSDIGYVYGEDDRMITAVIAILKRELITDEEIRKWLESFANAVLTCNSYPEKIIIRTNAKNFLQSLYFRLQWQKMAVRFNAAIAQTLKKISLYTNHTS